MTRVNYEHFDCVMKFQFKPTGNFYLQTCKKKHREFVLHEEFSKAVASINNDLSEEDKVLFFSLDLDAVFQE